MAVSSAYYTREEAEWIKEHINDAPFDVLADMFNQVFPRRKRTGSGLRWLARQEGIEKDKRFVGFVYSEEHIAFLKEYRRGNSVSALTDMFNKRFGTSLSKASVESKLHKAGIYEPSFPIGSETVENGIVFVKVYDTGKTRKDWVQKHRLIWEKAHGKLRRREAVLFLDGDRRNFSLDNLYKVSAGVASNLRVYGWLFTGQRELQECAIKWCECVEYIKQHYNPDFHMQEWERREFGRRKEYDL